MVYFVVFIFTHLFSPFLNHWLFLWQANSKALKIEAEGKKDAAIIEAQAYAQSTIIRAQATSEKLKIEALARNEAAKMLSDPFSKELLLREVNVNVISGLKAQHLTLIGQTPVSTLLNQSLSSSSPLSPTIVVEN